MARKICTRCKCCYMPMRMKKINYWTAFKTKITLCKPCYRILQNMWHETLIKMCSKNEKEI